MTLVGHDWGARAEKRVVASVGYETGIKLGGKIPVAQIHAYWYQWFCTPGAATRR